MNTTLTIITFTAAVYGLVMGIIMAFSIRPQLLHQEKLYISHNKITGFTQALRTGYDGFFCNCNPI